MSDQKQMGDMLTEKHTILDQNPFNPDTYVSTIFSLQRKFASRFIPFDRCLKDLAEQRKWNLELAVCTMDELSEVLNWLPFKHWKTYTNFEWKPTELKFELIDILHFLVNIAQVNNFQPAPDLLKPLAPRDQTADPAKLQLSFKPLMLSMASNLADLEVADTVAAKNLTIRRCFRILAKMFGLFSMTEEEVYNYYTSKNQENYERQERGY